MEVEPFEFDANGWQPSFAYIAYRLTPSATSENARAAMTVLVDKLTDNGADELLAKISEAPNLARVSFVLQEEVFRTYMLKNFLNCKTESQVSLF